MLPYIHQLKMLVKENQITKSEAHKLLKEAKFEYNSRIKAYTIWHKNVILKLKKKLSFHTG